MIKQKFGIEDYWEVIVYYDVDYNFFDDVVLELRLMGFPKSFIEDVWKTLKTQKAKAVTCNSYEEHKSIVIFNSHSSKADYINSIVHEAEHIKQAMLKVYGVDDIGEAPAYTIGHIVSKMYEVFKQFLMCE